MPWNHTMPEDERLQLVVETFEGDASVTELATAFGVSRKTAYKWLARFDAEGPPGLVDRSHARHSHPQAVSEEVAERIVAVRVEHPTWGPRKLLASLERHEPELPLPAASTVAMLLKRRGLSKPRRRHRRVEPGRSPFAEDKTPNDVWCVDFKGQFRLGDGSMCYPLTVTDACSRYLLACVALRSTGVAGARKAFEQVFRQYGLPSAIRSDNGVPFASNGPGALTALSAWWISLGIRHDRIEPGRPDQNGRHERMHRTLEEALHPRVANISAQQRVFDEFRRVYNDERPHEAIDMRSPAELYVPSLRPLPHHVPRHAYPLDHLLRTVSSAGSIRWRTRRVPISRALAGHELGLVEVSPGVWNVYFAELRLGWLRDDRPGTLFRQTPPRRVR
jgi:transposase InsO family protein